MYCPACGVALSQKTKYCNRCGAKLAPKKKGGERDPAEKRLDDYLDGLFWITFFGCGFILGGLVLMKKVLQLSDALVISYVVLSSLAFAVNFGLNLWQIIRMTRNPKAQKGAESVESLETNDLEPAKEVAFLDAAPSVTENTTRGLEQVSNERLTR